MYKYLLILLVVLSQNAISKTFSQLTSNNYFTYSKVIAQDQYVDVKLLIQFPSDLKTEIPVQLFYAINGDTITEYHSLKKLYAGAIKVLQVSKDDQLTVGIKILTPNDTVVVSGIKGDLNIVESNVSNIKNKTQLILVTGYLESEENSQIFKFEIPKDTLLDLAINIKTTEQFLMDSIHFQVSFMLPNGSFGSQDFSLLVNQGDYLNFNKKQLVAKINKLVKIRGSYVFQFVLKNDKKYLNGIKEISLNLESSN